MSTHRTAWHFFFVILLRKRGPRWLEVREEVPLSEEPLRLDYLFLRKPEEARLEDVGQSLRGLWARLSKYTIAELKTLGRPYGSRGLDRLWSYMHLFFANPENSVDSAADLSGVLIVPSRTPTLHEDVTASGLAWLDLGSGYWELQGGRFRLYLAEIDTVAEREDDDLLRLFGHGKERTLEARRFWAEQVGTKEAMMAAEDLEEYYEAAQKFLDLLPPEKRMIGLSPEQRVAGLSPEQLLLALPDEVLRGFSEVALAELSEPTRAALRKRLGR